MKCSDESSQNNNRICCRFANTIFMSIISIMVALSGCIINSDSGLNSNSYYLNPEKDFSKVGKVTFIEFENESPYQSISSDIVDALYPALQKKQIFSFSVIRQNDSVLRNLNLATDSIYTLEQILDIRQTLNCDVILIGTITRFSPYPHTSLGLRMKLLDLRDGQLLWAMEQVWDSQDKTTKNRVKKYFKSQKSSDSSIINEQLVIVSQTEFFKFVSYEVAETLSLWKNL